MMNEAKNTQDQINRCENEVDQESPMQSANFHTTENKKSQKIQNRITLSFFGRENDMLKVEKIMEELNNKTYGQKLTTVDLFMHLLAKITPKDIELIKQSSLSPREKLTIYWQQQNEKSGSSLSLDEFICRQLKL